MDQGRGRTSGAQIEILRSVAALRSRVEVWHAGGAKLGAVPTMGGLHEGHLELVRQAKTECDRVVVSLFVNPIQFDRKEDLAHYPRDEAGDAAKLEALGVDLLYAPALEAIYPHGFATKVAVAGLSDCLCGTTRPGYLDGVATVVAKLLMQIQPQVAYFGEKDYQQLLVVRQMVRDLDIPTKIRSVATLRESDGLALSSRNQLLNQEQRERAPSFYRTLCGLAAEFKNSRKPAAPALAAARQALLDSGFDAVDYLELRDSQGLESLARADRPARVFGAVWLGKVRLIDNVAVN